MLTLTLDNYKDMLKIRLPRNEGVCSYCNEFIIRFMDTNGVGYWSITKEVKDHIVST